MLHSFTGADGVGPYAAVILDGSGNLYGTTANGGSANDGTVFKLHPNPDGNWTETCCIALRAAHMEVPLCIAVAAHI